LSSIPVSGRQHTLLGAARLPFERTFAALLKCFECCLSPMEPHLYRRLSALLHCTLQSACCTSALKTALHSALCTLHCATRPQQSPQAETVWACISHTQSAALKARDTAHLWPARRITSQTPRPALGSFRADPSRKSPPTLLLPTLCPLLPSSLLVSAAR